MSPVRTSEFHNHGSSEFEMLEVDFGFFSKDRILEFVKTSSPEVGSNVNLEQCKGVHCVDLGESFQTHVYLQNLASIQPRTSPVKFAASRDKPGRPQVVKKAAKKSTASPKIQQILTETCNLAGARRGRRRRGCGGQCWL